MTINIESSRTLRVASSSENARPSRQVAQGEAIEAIAPIPDNDAPLVGVVTAGLGDAPVASAITPADPAFRERTRQMLAAAGLPTVDWYRQLLGDGDFLNHGEVWEEVFIEAISPGPRDRSAFVHDDPDYLRDALIRDKFAPEELRQWRAKEIAQRRLLYQNLRDFITNPATWEALDAPEPDYSAFLSQAEAPLPQPIEQTAQPTAQEHADSLLQRMAALIGEIGQVTASDDFADAVRDDLGQALQDLSVDLPRLSGALERDTYGTSSDTLGQLVFGPERLALDRLSFFSGTTEEAFRVGAVLLDAEIAHITAPDAPTRKAANAIYHFLQTAAVVAQRSLVQIGRAQPKRLLANERSAQDTAASQAAWAAIKAARTS